MKSVPVANLTLSNDAPLTVIAGPCQLESLDHALMIAEAMAKACADAFVTTEAGSARLAEESV